MALPAGYEHADRHNRGRASLPDVGQWISLTHFSSARRLMMVTLPVPRYEAVTIEQWLIAIVKAIPDPEELGSKHYPSYSLGRVALLGEVHSDQTPVRYAVPIPQPDIIFVDPSPYYVNLKPIDELGQRRLGISTLE